MKDILYFILDRMLFIGMTVAILIEDTLSSFEKCLLVLIVGILLSLSEIKDGIKNRTISSK